MPIETIRQTDWDELYNFAVRQSLIGSFYAGIISSRQLYPEAIEKKILFKWALTIEKITKKNEQVNKRTKELTAMLSEAGFRCCLLKGQGIAQLYPTPLHRIAGDIDLWVDGDREELTTFIRLKTPNTFEQYHHIDFPIFEDVSVEIHFTPTRMSNPIYNHRLQQFYKQNLQAQFANRCPDLGNGTYLPTNSFNAVFLLAHIMSHYFMEGIGLRQFVDYYYLLKEDFTDEEKASIQQTLRHLNMLKFSRGVMWIEQYVLGAKAEWLLLPADEKVGKHMLQEILRTGDLGKYDERWSFRERSKCLRFISDNYQALRQAKLFPSEALFKPLAKLVNQQWKLKDYFYNRSNRT